MERRTLFKDGNFYKGNTHSHTTVSDGGGTPAEVVKAYKTAGYSFLAMTDHLAYGFDTTFNADDFLVLPATELDTLVGGIHHVVAVGHPNQNQYMHGYRFDYKLIHSMTAQQIIDEVNAHGNLAILAHPYWSKVDYTTEKDLRGLFAMEIMNNVCETTWRSGNAEFFFDHFLWDHNYMWWIGSDDLHDMGRDMFGGFITVKCAKLTYDDLFDALKKGSFFASYSRTGNKAPLIRDFYVKDGSVFLDCFPCGRIYFKSNGSQKPFYNHNGDLYAHAEWSTETCRDYVYAVCVDSDGNISWTQPILL
jgi:hypothetical protein